MRKQKIVLLSLFFIFFICILSQANECKVNNQTGFSFKTYSKNITDFDLTNKIATNYAWSNSEKEKFFLYLGIAGAIVFGSSWFLTTPGIVLIVIAIKTYGPPAAYIVGSTAFAMFASGVALLVVGQVMCWLGLGAMIAGFVLHYYYKNRFSMFFETDTDEARIMSGIAIKL